LLSQGKDDNEAGWEKDKQETVYLDARVYSTSPPRLYSTQQIIIQQPNTVNQNISSNSEPQDIRHVRQDKDYS
jgi:hypothetical protein